VAELRKVIAKLNSAPRTTIFFYTRVSKYKSALQWPAESKNFTHVGRSVAKGFFVAKWLRKNYVLFKLLKLMGILYVWNFRCFG